MVLFWFFFVLFWFFFVLFRSFLFSSFEYEYIIDKKDRYTTFVN